MKAALYARYSSENQRESSIEDQIRLCRDEAARSGADVVNVYHDSALSGSLTEEQRPGLQAMLRDAEAKMFDLVIVDDLSRLSRDQVSALQILRRLEYWGVGFIARSDGINSVNNAKSSRFLSGIKGVMAEEFLRDLAEKTHRGLEGVARKGLSPGGLPYGYRSTPVTDERGQIVGYRRIVHEPEAETVRRIFTLYADGLSSRLIVYQLNAEGIAPPGARWQNRKGWQASTWGHTAILGQRRLGKGILSNPLYTGQQVWNRSQWMRHPDTKKFRYRVRPKDDWITHEDPTLRIVPQDLWDRVQARMAAQRIGGVRKGAPGKYVLSGLLRCGVCGGSYVIKSQSVYYCATWRNRGSMVCANGHTLSRRRAEKAIFAAIKDRLYTAENLVALVAEVRTLLQERARQYAAHDTVATHERRRLALDTEIANLEAAVLTGKATAHLLAMLDARVKEREALAMRTTKTEEPEALAARLASVLERLPTIVAQALEDLETLLGTQQVERGRQVIQALLSEVRLYPITDNGKRRLEAELVGNLSGTLSLVSGQSKKTPLMWLGEEDSNPH